MNTAPLFVLPSAASTLAFLGVVAFVCFAWVFALRRAWPENKARVTGWAAIALSVCLAVTAGLAKSGILAAQIGSPRAAAYFAVSNLLALALVFSPLGRRVATTVPLLWLVGVHAFRLPLELVLHSWFEQGSLPVQMTYVGDNWDILTGIFASVLIVFLPRVPRTVQYWLALAFTGVGLTLLLRVMSIAVRSTPWPLRTYLNDPPVLLAFYVPYTWIVPMCVSSALFAHGVALRWLWVNRSMGTRALRRVQTQR